MATKRGWGLTCTCGVYPHPHRLGGGKCDGTEWVRAYSTYHRGACFKCVYNERGVCLFESESLEECAGYRELKEAGGQLELPMNDEELGEALAKKYFD